MPLVRIPYLLSLLLAGCVGASGDDGTSTSAAGLDRCADGTAPLSLLWSVDNLHGEIVSMSPIAPDGTIVLGTADGAVKQWALGTSSDTSPLAGGRPSYGEPFTESGQPARALALGDGEVLAGDDGVGVRAWSIPDAAALGGTQLEGSPISAIAPATDTQAVIADTAFAGEMRTVDLTGAAGTGGVFTTTLFHVTSLLAHDGALFDAGDDYGMAAIERRDLASPTSAADRWDTLELGGSIRATAISSDGATIATGGDGHVLVFDAASLEDGPTARLALIGTNGPVTAKGVAFTPAHLAVVTDDGRAMLYLPDLSAPAATIATPSPIGVAIDPSGERMVIASSDGHLRAYGCPR